MDDLGNRSGYQALRSGPAELYTDDGTNTNRYSTIAGNFVAYDDAGNLTTDRNGYSYDYDYENRIVSIYFDINRNGIFETGDTRIVKYTYDALNRRIKTDDLVTAANTRLYYYNDRWQVLNEYDNQNNFTAFYIYGKIEESHIKINGQSAADYFKNMINPILAEVYHPKGCVDEVLYTANTTGGYYYLHDHLFSPVALLDYISGSVVERYEYNAYGKAAIYDSNFTLRTSTLHNNPYLFTCRRLDNLNYNQTTGQYDYEIMYYRNRYYDTTMGRFLTHDPLRYSDGMNLYEYVISNPLMYSDALGLSKKHESAIDNSDGKSLTEIDAIKHCITSKNKW